MWSPGDAVRAPFRMPRLHAGHLDPAPCTSGAVIQELQEREKRFQLAEAEEQMGARVADPVKYELGAARPSTFESADGSLISLRGGEPESIDAGKLGTRLQQAPSGRLNVS